MAREILWTLRFVLYKWEDEPSCELAMKAGFDLAQLGLDVFIYSSDDDSEGQEYRYWSVRLLALMKAVEGSKRSHHVRRWTETGHVWLMQMQHSPLKCAMLILTALALLVAIVFGIFGLLMQKQDSARQIAIVVGRTK